MTRSVKQGDPLSPILFNAVIDEISTIPEKRGIKVGDKYLNTLAFADDLCIITSSAAGLQTCLKHRERGSTYRLEV